ncbi:hypothetical protein J7W19_11965 [Streptomyces mobaraensis NBRC 13819 = DSM 40847]|uniref:Uncharacterized protein n=2 Tax=Streptomyces mobaraensis TaxID=35621 RepID=A0A5N5WC21_STRMB|nr:hypothetical protein [Streptomyces mobaraensis]EME97948.1 hypothetical protein H340_23958 [Streptomyces mobaraensis NBRC 13819 = DSM 40847]KAB7849856.1 hypothetical protein FRZ00_04220 [Streptomyces mobaraensis]QTT74033.1 hypothetical protein J7W19_11965 [Streptomyces mobaraensis NBRC 13819 = DSM 40847]
MPEKFDQAPRKSQAVVDYERIAGKGAWYDEAGCTLALFPLIGALLGFGSDFPGGYAVLLLVPVVVWLWALAIRRAFRLRPLSADTRDYVRRLVDAEERGVSIPQPSAALQPLYRAEKTMREHRVEKPRKKQC